MLLLLIRNRFLWVIAYIMAQKIDVLIIFISLLFFYHKKKVTKKVTTGANLQESGHTNSVVSFVATKFLAEYKHADKKK